VIFEIICGVLGGIIAGMGMGGGTLLIPLLVIFLHFDQLQAQTINLIAFLPMALVTLFIHFKNGLVDFKKAWLIALFGVIGSIAGGFATTLVESETLKVFFGTFLVVLGTFSFAKSLVKKEKNSIYKPMFNKQNNNQKLK